MRIPFVRSLFSATLFLLGISTSAALDPDSLLRVWNDTQRSDTARFDAYFNYLRRSQVLDNGSPDSLAGLFTQLHDLAVHAKSAKRQGKALSMIAYMRFNAGRIEEAIVTSECARVLYADAGAKRDEMTVLNAMGQFYMEKGDIASAIDRLTSALHIADALQDSSFIARVHGNIGIMHYTADDTANAMVHYRARLAIAERIGQKDILCEVLNNMALVHTDGGRPDLAVPELERSLAIAREIDYPEMQVNCLHNLGDILNDRGDHAEAFALYNEALGIASKNGSPELMSEVTIARGWSYLDMGDRSKARADGEQAIALATEHGFVLNVRDAAELLYEVYKAEGRDTDALRMHERFILMKDSIASDENRQELMQQKFQYDYDKKEALLHAEQEKKDAVAAEELRHKNLQRNAFIGGFGLMVLLAGTFFFQRNRISKEKKRSEELLLNILPEEVAEELKAKGEAEAKLINEVTVLFTDFKGFTAMSETLSPKELVRDLNECFSAFDHIMAKHGIEKIKTIGDAYMAAGGLPTPNSTHALDVVKAALEIRNFIAEGKARKVAAGLPFFEIRIGVHTGPVVAGIVGVKKFAYDIWGDTVNTASRMESSGEVGQVNISESTYGLVKDTPGLTFTPRGKVQAKGKGELEMYFVANP